MNRINALLVLLTLPVMACVDEGDPTIVVEDDVAEPGGDAIPEADLLAACGVSGTQINRSLVVTDPEVLAKFSFTRVMSRIRTTAGIAPTTNKALFQSWMKTFGATSAAGDCNDAGIDPNKYGLQCPRTPEVKLAGVDPFVATSGVTFKPVGLFNRFDLAPSTGANCGEYRIVYAMQSTNPNIGGRALIIFEAALPNPNPSAGKAACLPVAQFWQGLTTDASVTSRAAKLEKFYLTGGAVAGFPTVVHARHYGFATNAAAATVGQVRTNFFVDFDQWHLREFKLRRTCSDPANTATCSLRFQHVTVKSNPAEELFAGTHSRSSAFLTAFPNQVAALARNNVSTIAMSIGNQFNEFESVSQAGNVVYENVASTAMRDAIRTKLTAMGSGLTVTNILDRATTQTCAGCHQVSSNVNLGGGQTWPESLFFVHIDESSALSPALTTKFLPHRKTVLESFINANCVGIMAAEPALHDDMHTIGGSAIGAPN